MEVNLLGKTELWITGICLRNVNLSELAKVVSETLGLKMEEVFVIDAGPDHVVIDVIRNTVKAEHIYGKKTELLKKLGSIAGVEVSDRTSIHSEGVLGFIELDEQFARKVLTKTKDIADELRQKISRRCMVFPTGEEVRKDIIKDTNSPYIKKRLESEGYKVAIGPVLPDDEYLIAAAVMNSIDEGYGLIITTGGVGAEAKDRTIEALRKIDPKAATPYIMKFHQGTGRHAKAGVMIGVGTFGLSIIISLPGPNDEVKLSLEQLIEGFNMEFDKHELADKIARTIKKKYIPKCSRT